MPRRFDASTEFLLVSRDAGWQLPTHDSAFKASASPRSDRSAHEAPAGAEFISSEGVTVLPGLWDMHVQLMLNGHCDCPLPEQIEVHAPRAIGVESLGALSYLVVVEAGEREGAQARHCG